MADEARAAAWKEAEKLIEKGKTGGALDILRAADPDGGHATTLRLAGQAVHIQAQKSNSKSQYRKAARLLRDSVKMNPRDKTANALYNQIRNEMQDKSIPETIIPRLMNDGTPTPAGLFAVVAALLLILAGIQAARGGGEFEDGEALMTISWTDAQGNAQQETITIALHRAEAPIHVENFILLSQAGKYDGVEYHRVINGFMIQSGDFEKGNGQGGYAAKWYGYCNGQTVNSTGDPYTAENCQLNAWSIPDEADNGLVHEPGSLAMAKTSAPHTGGSQFYLVPSDSTPSHLDGVHTVFGTVTDGLEHVTSVSDVQTEPGDKPTHPVTIVSVEITHDGVIGDPWWQFW